MLLASWNINGLRARLDFLRHWLRARQPDIVGLQELKLEEPQFPFAELEAEGYRALVHGQKAWNGVAILSRNPAKLLDKGLEGSQGPEARLLSAEIGNLVFVTVYCPNGKDLDHPDFRWKLEWLDRLNDFVRTRLDPGRPAILCGDFNLCPEPLDSWDEERLRGTIFHTEEERERFRRLKDQGFVDLFRYLHPERRAFSWWDYRAGAFHKNEGLRIDLILGAGLADRVESAEIDREYRKKKDGLTPSDHAPVMVRLREG
jgi:exodeoxyribonuclease-3